MRNKFFNEYGSFYFLGIGGVSMSSLAKYLVAIGKRVAGYDRNYGVYTAELIELGVKVTVGEPTDSIKDFDVIVYTDAIREDNPILQEAAVCGKITMSRGQLLYEVSRMFARTIAISGCHGKTTCTSMLAHIFQAAGKRFFAHIGGRDLTYGNCLYSGDDYLVTEACEYKKNFLLLKPTVAVLLNCGADHLECYGNYKNLISAYRQFLVNSDFSITLSGDEVAGNFTFGLDKEADITAKSVTSVDGKYSFTVYDRGERLGRVSLSVEGRHNVLNALAAIAAALSVGIAFRYVQEGLADFNGVERRFETLGYINGAKCIADYAHHPDEIEAAIRTARRNHQKVFVVFQPHTYSRTKLLYKDFVKVLSGLENLMIYRTFAAREYYDDAGSALTLSRGVKKSRYGSETGDILEFISAAKAGECILFLGAGDIYDIAKDIVGKS